MKKKYAIAGGVAAVTAAAAYSIWQKNRQWKPKEAFPVTGFDIEKYMGKWYEIARLDYKYEKNLSNTTAEYRLNKGGTVQVINRGYNEKSGKWVEAKGEVLFRDEKEKAALKVSFFKPFYSGYNVVGLDANYSAAMIAGNDLNYLWIISRDKELAADIRDSFLDLAEGIGYDTAALIWVQHDREG